MKGLSEVELDEEDLEFELDEGVGTPLVEEYVLQTENSNSGINLFWA